MTVLALIPTAAASLGRVDAVRSLTFGAYLTRHWLPAKQLHLATSTYRCYERNVKLHVPPLTALSASGPGGVRPRGKGPSSRRKGRSPLRARVIAGVR